MFVPSTGGSTGTDIEVADGIDVAVGIEVADDIEVAETGIGIGAE